MDYEQSEYERLGMALHARLDFLGWTVAECHRQMQASSSSRSPSIKTVHNTLNARNPPESATRRAFEVALGLEPGTCARILEGEDVPMDAPLPARPLDRLASLEAEVAGLRGDVDVLLRRVLGS